MNNVGLALIAVLSKVLPQTASCLLPLPGFEFEPGLVRKMN